MKPTHFPDWATEEEVDGVSGQLNRVEPPSSSKESGWTRREIPPRQWMNWILWKISLWIRFFEERENRPETFEVSSLPSATTLGAGKIIYVSDAAGGAILVFSDGSDWRRVDDRGIVS